MKKNVVLIGFMGTGKTTVGTLLADRIGFTFIDTDELIFQYVKMPIGDIFFKYGEQYFRELEGNMIQTNIFKHRIVLATGGGAILNPNNLRIIKKYGIVIALEASIDILWNRLHRCTDRPLLLVDNPREKLEEMYIQRQPIYREAHYLINVDNKLPEEVVNEILLLLK